MYEFHNLYVHSTFDGYFDNLYDVAIADSMAMNNQSFYQSTLPPAVFGDILESQPRSEELQNSLADL